MLDGAVVPEDNHVGLPPVPVVKFVNQSAAIDRFQKLLTFGSIHAFDIERKLRAYKNGLPAGHRVYADDGVGDLWKQILIVPQFGDAFFRFLKDKFVGDEIVYSLEIGEEPLHAVRQAFIDRAHAGKVGIAAQIRDDL